MKHFSLFLMMLLWSAGMTAATVYDFSASIPKGWESNPAPRGYEPDSRGTQYDMSAILTLAGVSDVTEVKITASSNMDTQANSYKLSVTVGGKDFGSYTLPKVTNEIYTFSGEPASGDLVVTITKNGSKKSLWIKEIAVEGTVPEPENPADRLNPDYVYEEPTIILPKDNLDKMPLDTVINNILLSCAQGAFYETDIRVMAGNAITFTATKPIKAIRIDGTVKKSFSASASAGILTYASSDETDMSDKTPVLLIKDIDENAVTLTCAKQLQMQKIYIYFDQNPDVEIEESGEEEAVPVENCIISAEGEWNFVASYTDTQYLWFTGTVGITMISNPEWQFYSDGYPWGEGEGMYLFVEFIPQYVYPDWNGTYSFADYTITGNTYGYYYKPGEGDEDDEFMSYFFTDGSITVELIDGAYNLTYSLTDTDDITHAGTIYGICAEPGQPMGIEETEVVLDNNVPMYNILGQPVSASYRGIIIQNRHKFLLMH